MESKKMMNAFTGEKAGMATLDREKINETIIRLTKNTARTIKEENDKRKAEAEVEIIKRRLNEMKSNQEHYDRIKKLADERITSLKLEIDTSKRWLHIDMDAFFAAVEIRDEPSLADKPVAVGGKGIISASNYIARQFGVRSAMPTFIALELCPSLIILPVKFHKYQTASTQIMAILAEYDPDMEQIASDEAYLDLTAYCATHNLTSTQHLHQLCDEIKTRINRQTGLTASVGISYNRMLSKLSSEENKPDGVFILVDKDVDAFLEEKKVRKIHGIGPRAEYRLNLLGIETIKDIKENYVDLFYINENDLKDFDRLMKKSHGVSRNEHSETQELSKSIGKSKTFKKTRQFTYLYMILDECLESVYDELEKKNLACRSISIDIMSENEINTSATSSNMNMIIYKDQAKLKAKKCFDKLAKNCPDKIRLIRFTARMLIKRSEITDSEKPNRDIHSLLKNIKPATAEEIKKSKFKKQPKEKDIRYWFGTKENTLTDNSVK